MQNPTTNDIALHELLYERWSPLAFADRPVPTDVLATLFEAARWSPSCFNEQPWRFIVGSRPDDPATFDKLFSTLMEMNQKWVSTAPVLFLGIYRLNFSHNETPNVMAPYDLGQAVAHLTFQAAAEDLYVHQMGGFDRDKARATLGIPDTYGLGAMVALGYLGEPDRLSDEKQRERHRNPTRSRRPLAEIVLSAAGNGFGETSPVVP